ncbi:MAG: YbfB/YjiJ family MFS transporter [Pseudonocardiaceae bacterium]
MMVGEHPGRSPDRDLLVALGLAVGPAVALGLARFAYALLLPPMRSSLHWSFAAAGAMNTANAAGYLVGALAATTISRRWGARRVFVGGVVATGVFLLASAATGSVPILLALRVLAGASGAASFIVGGPLAVQLGHGKAPARGALLLGVYFGGGGLGIALSGVAIPPLLARLGPAAGWRWGWVLLAVVTALSVLAAAPAARHTPEPAARQRHEGFPIRTIEVVLVGYTVFGAGYIAYMTFIVAYLQAGGAGTAEVSAFWVVLGVAAIGGGFGWGPMLGRLRGGRGPAVLMGVVTVGALPPLLTHAIPVAFASALLFGASFLAVVTAVTTVARTALRPDQWTAAIATLTTGFALGQCLGPALAGALADSAAGVRAGLLLSVIILAVGAVVCVAQPVQSPDDQRAPETGPPMTTSTSAKAAK